jgi:hypothetical protein
LHIHVSIGTPKGISKTARRERGSGEGTVENEIVLK